MSDRQIEKLTRSYKIIEQRFLLGHAETVSLANLLTRMRLTLENQFLSHYAGIPPLWRILMRSFSGKRTLPDFAVVGPIKSGSSDLVTHLLLHPNILAPLAKEIYSPEPVSWRPFYPTVKQKNRVAQEEGIALSGFLAPFLHWFRLMDRFAVVCPEAKIIIPLRNPISRAYSHWKWDVLQGGRSIKNLDYYSSFEKFVKVALDLFPELHMDTVCGFPFLESGIYHKAVEQWMNRFGRERVLVFDVNDYFQDRNAALERIQKFLGIPVIRFSEAEKPINQNPIKKNKMDEATRERLAAFYEPFNRKLFHLINKEFTWA